MRLQAYAGERCHPIGAFPRAGRHGRVSPMTSPPPILATLGGVPAAVSRTDAC